MANMANNQYHQIAQEIMAQGGMLENGGEEETIEVPLSLFSQMEQELAKAGKLAGGESAATDGDIASVVMQALQKTGGDVSKYPDAIGVTDFGTEEDAAAMVEQLQGMSPEEQAAAINEYMEYAGPGPEAILQVLQQFSQGK